MPRRRPFRLATLLRVRERVEELKSQELASTRHDMFVAQQQRQHLMEEQNAVIQKACEITQGKFDPKEAQQYYSYEEQLANLVVMAKAQISRLRVLEQSKCKELEEAMKQRQVVDRLKERDDKAFADEVRKEEQKLNDEVASIRAAASRTNRLEQ